MNDRAQSSLRALVERFGLTAHTAEQLACLRDLLVRAPDAPTAIHDPARVLEDHIADSLTGLALEPVRAAGTLVDLGSGAGLPGLVLAAALPGCAVTLVESAQRKAAFIERAAATCEITNVEVLGLRAEEVHLRDADVVTARALASLAVVAEYAAPLLRVGGTLVAWRGRRDAEAELEGEKAAAELGLVVGDIVPARPYAGAEHRYLHLMSKVRETPARFPRRPGIARKRPLGRA